MIRSWVSMSVPMISSFSTSYQEVSHQARSLIGEAHLNISHNRFSGHFCRCEGLLNLYIILNALLFSIDQFERVDQIIGGLTRGRNRAENIGLFELKVERLALLIRSSLRILCSSLVPPLSFNFFSRFGLSGLFLFPPFLLAFHFFAFSGFPLLCAW